MVKGGNMPAQKLRLGIVQMDCRFGDVPGNLNHAGELVEAAARQGAEMILLPELMPGGYTLSEEIWNCAEPLNGQTAAWLASTARQFKVYLGTSFLEAQGEDFYNTFALATPSGALAGLVRKSPPASLEAFFYRAGNGSHVIETELGRVGVGICYENLLYERLQTLYFERVDLVLQPTAASRPMPMKPGDGELFDNMLRRSAPHTARALGAPVAMANRTGLLQTEMPGGYGFYSCYFAGLSQIVNSDGQVKARLGAEEGAAVADVELEPARRPARKPRCFGKLWAIPMPWYAFIWPQTQHEGEPVYAANPRRPQAALRVQAGEAQKN
jgi:N-carbamoylputrescine amidase